MGFISSILLVFVSYNFFEHIAVKEKKKNKLKAQYMGSDNTLNVNIDGQAEICNITVPCGDITTRKNKFLLQEGVQLIVYTLALCSFPLMFSLPYHIHKTYENSSEDSTTYVHLLALKPNKDSICLVLGFTYWMALVIT